MGFVIVVFSFVFVCFLLCFMLLLLFFLLVFLFLFLLFVVVFCLFVVGVGFLVGGGDWGYCKLFVLRWICLCAFYFKFVVLWIF